MTTPNREFDLSSLSAISNKKSNLDELIDIKDEKNRKLIDKERLYLDVELNLRAEDENSFDEDHFNFEKNSQNFLKEAFDIDKTKKKKWQDKFIKMAKEEELIKDKKEIDQFLAENSVTPAYMETFPYSFNLQVDNIQEVVQNDDFYTTYFTKFLITVNLIFRVSYLYKYSYDLGYNKAFNTIFRMLTLQLFDFNNQSSLFSIDNTSNQIGYFGLVFIWIFSFFILFCLVRYNRIKRIVDLENFTVKYDYRTSSGMQSFIFNLFLTFCLYLYIPIVRDAIMTIFFIVESVSSTSTFQIFFQTTDSRNIILWIKFFLCCAVSIVFFWFPFFLYGLLKNNHPLINPFDNLNDTIFHSTACPKNCSGALLDVEKRMCWDFVKDNLFFADLNRPINRLDMQTKVNNVLLRYYTDCNAISSPMMILFKGYSFAYKNYLFWFLIKHYIFLFIVKIPYSTLFSDFAEDNLNKRSLISYTFSIVVCLYFIYDNLKNWNGKFNYRHDMVLNIVMNTFIMLICIFGILKIIVVGGYMFESIQNSPSKNNILIILELLSFGSLALCVFILTIFMIYSIPQIRSKIKKKKLSFPYEWLNPSITDTQFINGIKDHLWKPFLDSLFNNDTISNCNVNYQDEKFIHEHLNGKRLEDTFNPKGLAFNSNGRVNIFKRKLVENEETNDTDLFRTDNNPTLINENLYGADILLRKLIQFKLEGVDVFWDGDVIGRRSCLSFFGRLIISEFPYKLIMIYDETNEKVEIPMIEWVSLCKLNLQNEEILRQVKIRDQLRSLHKKVIKYDEFFFEKHHRTVANNKNNILNNKLKENKLIKKVGGKKVKNKTNNLDEEIEETSVDKELKIGTLFVETLIPENPFTHGFKIYLKVHDPRDSSNIRETIIFNTNDISLNVRNFKYSKLNILLTMNDDLIREEEIFQIRQRKELYREERCSKVYINEVTLSSLFCILVYNNEEVTLIEIFKYFLHFEKQKQIKFLPYIHLEGLLRAINIWQLLVSNPIQSLWYLFFHTLWTRNKQLLTDLKVGKYFNPDTSLSICYYVFEKDKLQQFVNKLDLQGLITKEMIDKLDKRIHNIKQIEREKMKDKLIDGQQKGLVDLNEDHKLYKEEVEEENDNKYKRKNKKDEIDTSRVPLNNQNKTIIVEEDKLQTYLNKYQRIRDKLIEVLPEYTGVSYSTPSWVYLTYNNENDLNKLTSDEIDDLKQHIKTYFRNHTKYPEKLFKILGENAYFISLYTDNEIYELYDTKDLQCEDPSIAKFALENESLEHGHQDKKRGLTSSEWGSKQIDLVLPCVVSYINENLSRKLDSNFSQKVDHQGRVFYVDYKTKKTSFIHPTLSRREKTKSEQELEMLYGKLPDGWEIINFKNSNGDYRLLYIDHNLKRTSWIDPRKKKLN